MSARPGQRIAIVGTTGAGKTTLAGRLAHDLSLPHVELDALHWDRDWQAAEPGVFRARVDAALAGERWVADGNYSVARDFIWGRADTLVWLDFPLPTIYRRLLRRSVLRLVSGEELWDGNREHLAHHFTRDSLFLWALQTHGRRRAEFCRLLADPRYAHLSVVRLQAPCDVDKWVCFVEAGAAERL